MEWKTISITRHIEDQLKALKEEFDFEAMVDVVAYLLDLYLSVPSEVPKDEFYAMREKYITDYPEEFFATVLDLQGIKEPEVFVKAFEEVIQDRISKKVDLVPEGIVFECHHCGYVWRYGSGIKTDLFINRISIICPSCRYRVSRNDARDLIPLKQQEG